VTTRSTAMIGECDEEVQRIAVPQRAEAVAWNDWTLPSRSAGPEVARDGGAGRLGTPHSM